MIIIVITLPRPVKFRCHIYFQGTPGLHNKISAQKTFARGWVRKDGSLLTETGCTANLRTKIPDFGGFDSSRI